jgi:hypothetical protein
MKIDDFKCEVPNELKALAEEWQVVRCWSFPPNVWSVVMEMRKTAWQNIWGKQYK